MQHRVPSEADDADFHQHEAPIDAYDVEQVLRYPRFLAAEADDLESRPAISGGFEGEDD